jgi:hypothetical protein
VVATVFFSILVLIFLACMVIKIISKLKNSYRNNTNNGRTVYGTLTNTIPTVIQERPSKYSHGFKFS